MTDNMPGLGISCSHNLGVFAYPPKKHISKKYPLLLDDRWHLCWSVMAFVYAVIATSESEATLDESYKVYFLRRSDFVSHLMSHNSILRSSKK
jgi:hypothetical protein